MTAVDKNLVEGWECRGVQPRSGKSGCKLWVTGETFAPECPGEMELGSSGEVAHLEGRSTPAKRPSQSMVGGPMLTPIVLFWG